MKNAIKLATISALILLAALPAIAEVANPTLTHDPLMKQIMSKQLTMPDGGVTGAVRIGSGQAITLNLVDPLTTAAEPLKDAVADPKALTGLKPVEGLVVKPAKAKARRKIHRADEQLKKFSHDERRADWAGRKQP